MSNNATERNFNFKMGKIAPTEVNSRGLQTGPAAGLDVPRTQSNYADDVAAAGDDFGEWTKDDDSEGQKKPQLMAPR